MTVHARRAGLSAVLRQPVFGQQENAPSLPDVVLSLLNKAGCRVIVPVS